MDPDIGTDDDHVAADLSKAEREFLDRYSGTRDDPAAYEQVLAATDARRRTTPMPEVRGIDAIRAALPTCRAKDEAMLLTAFLDYGLIDGPDGADPVTVRAWLASGGDLDAVIRLTQSSHHAM